jgi:hypothetical protein
MGCDHPLGVVHFRYQGAGRLTARRGENGGRRTDFVEVRENFELERQIFGHRFDDQLRSGGGVEADAGLDASQDCRNGFGSTETMGGKVAKTGSNSFHGAAKRDFVAADHHNSLTASGKNLRDAVSDDAVADDGDGFEPALRHVVHPLLPVLLPRLYQSTARTAVQSVEEGRPASRWASRSADLP